MSAAGRYAAAFRALCEHNIADYEAGINQEAPSALNNTVIDAGRGVPWWRQMLIERRILRELDYWRRIGER